MSQESDRRGSSGAIIAVFNDRVEKRSANGSIPVGQQGTWLKERERSVALPNVTNVHDDKYTMELLIPELRRNNPTVLATEIVMTLRCHLWYSYTPICTLIDEEQLWRRIMSLKPDNYTLQALNWLWETAAKHESELVCTHGDPTFDNVMWRGDQLVLVDPYPSSNIFPDWKMVDVGRVLQSLLGYEAARYGYGTQWDIINGHHPVDEFRLMFSQRQFDAAMFWALVHLLRAERRTPESAQSAVRQCIIDGVRYIRGDV